MGMEKEISHVVFSDLSAFLENCAEKIEKLNRDANIALCKHNTLKYRQILMEKGNEIIGFIEEAEFQRCRGLNIPEEVQGIFEGYSNFAWDSIESAVVTGDYKQLEKLAKNISALLYKGNIFRQLAEDYKTDKGLE